MRVKDLKKKSNNRIDTSYLQSLGIQTYGQDNLYPQTLKNIIAASSTGSECSDRPAPLIAGFVFCVDLFFDYYTILGCCLGKRGSSADSGE